MSDEPFDWSKHLPPGMSMKEMRTTGKNPGACPHVLGTSVGSDGIMRIDRCGVRIPHAASWCSAHVGAHPTGHIEVASASACLSCGSRSAVKYSMVHSLTRRSTMAVLCERCSRQLAEVLAPLLKKSPESASVEAARVVKEAEPWTEAEFDEIE